MLCKAQLSLQVIYFSLHGLFVIPSLGYVTAHTGMTSAGLSGVYTLLLKPSVLFVPTMLRVWEITLLLGSSRFGLILPCLIIVLTSTQVLPTDGVNCRVHFWEVLYC